MSTAVHISLEAFLARPDREDDQREELLEGELYLMRPRMVSIVGHVENSFSVLLALISAVILIALCAFLGSMPVRCWALAAIIGFVTWSCYTFAGGRRPRLPALIASIALAVSWLPSSFGTIHAYLSPIPPAANQPVLTSLIVFWIVLLVVTIISSGSCFRVPQP